MALQKSILLATGLVIFSEALALLIGAGLIKKSRPEWLSQKNLAFLLDDILFGSVLMLFALGILRASWIFWLSTVCTFLSHAWRETEFVAAFPNKFCANTALFRVNNLKLSGLISAVLFKIRAT